MEKPENLLINVPKEQRAEQLEAMAAKTGIEKVKRQYTDDEKDQMKDFLMTESIELKDQNEEMAKIVKEFKAAIKKYKEGIADAVSRYKKGFSENEEKVYFMDDQETGVMNAFDANGEYLYTRKLFPDERQTTILTLDKTGTND